MKKRIFFGIFAVLIIGVGLLVYLGQKQTKESDYYYSGTIEATQANLAFQVSGRVLRIPIDEGQAVEKDQILAVLDASEFQSRVELAKANLESALKAREQLEALIELLKGTLPEEVNRAKAGVDMARNVFNDTWKNIKRYEALFNNGVISEKERDKAKLAFENAKLSLSQAEAVVKQAQSNLKKIDATLRDIELAKAQIDGAKATLNQAEIQLNYTRLPAPFSGVITTRNIEPGEVVTPGREVITVSDLSTVDLNIFVDETEIGNVIPGQTVDVRVDTFPDRSFKGKVAYISPGAEFTPKIIQTRKERVKLVYRVKVFIPNPDMALKTGIPADAYFR